MSDQIICGIDIGSSKIAVINAVCSDKSKDIRIIGYNRTNSIGVKKGLIVDIDKVTQVLEDSLEKAERMSGKRINQAYVVIGGPSISSLNSQGVVAVSDPEGEITQEDVNRAIEAAEAVSLPSHRELIEVLPREYIVNGQDGISNPIGMSGIRLEVETHIITASSTSLRNIEKVLQHTGVALQRFVFSGLASAEAVLSDTEKELGVVVVDIGGGKTDLCMYVENAVAYSSSLPLGAKNITNDLAIGLKTTLGNAEKLKLYLSRELDIDDFLASRSKKDEKINPSKIGLLDIREEFSVKEIINDIVLPRYEELFQLIGEEIEKSGFAEAIPSGLVITGGGALSPGLITIGKKILGLPMRVGYPQNITGLIDEVSSPEYASLVGLILYIKDNIINDTMEFKNFDRVLQNLSLLSQIKKIKELIKQFIPR
ncbi:MAG: cell division protein FtsA [Patescibacteria group bacterium]|nr:MAG: cell division protein FtsA [Patescibacteria group bacterium]